MGYRTDCDFARCVTGAVTKGRRQVVDSRAMAAKPGRVEEQDAKARAEARARQRAAMQAKQDASKVLSCCDILTVAVYRLCHIACHVSLATPL